MTEPVSTGTSTPAAPASRPGSATGNDTYGDKAVSLTNLPVIGYQGKGGFKPVEEQGQTEQQDPVTDNQDPVVEDGQPVTEQQDPVGESVLKALNGKTFKDAKELLATYNSSAPEAKRLADENKTFRLTVDDMNNKLSEANAAILKLNEYVSNSAYTPTVPDRYKGMQEQDMLQAMTEDEKLDYKLDKREWNKKVEGFKAQMARAKEESEAIATQTKAEIAKTEQVMSQDMVNYPEYAELAPLREEILKESPHLANRVDSPYVTYYMAMGILALKERNESKRLESESRSNAGKNAQGSAAAAGSGGNAGAGRSSNTPKNDGLRGLVKAGKSLKGAF